MTYLIFATRSKEEGRISREWWKNFINSPAESRPEALTVVAAAPGKGRRRKRRRSRPAE